MKCTPLFLDKDGNRSLDYYSNLHKGHDEALEIYAKSMFMVALAKHQRTGKVRGDAQGIKDYLKIESTVEAASESNGNKYIFEGTPLDRVSEALAEAKGQSFDKMSVAKEMAYNAHILEAVASNPEIYGYTRDVIDNMLDTSNFSLKVKKIIKDSPAMVARGHKDVVEYAQKQTVHDVNNKMVKKFLDVWEDKNLLGTANHDLFQFYSEERNKLVRNKQGNYNKAELSQAVQTAITKADNRNSLPENAGRSTIDGPSAEKLLGYLETFFASLPEGSVIKPELIVFNKAVRLGGRMDILVFDQNDVGHVYDFKTKESGEQNKFFASHGKYTDFFESMMNSKLNDVALQTSLYRWSLEEMGIKMGDSYVIYVEAELSGAPNRKYTNFNPLKIIRLDYKKAEIVDWLVKDRGYVQEEASDLGADGKPNNYNHVINTLWSGALSGKTEEQLRKQATSIVNNGKGFYKDYLKKTHGEKVTYKSSDKEANIKEVYEYLKKYQESDPIKKEKEKLTRFFHAGKQHYHGKGKTMEDIGSVAAEGKALMALRGVDQSTHSLINPGIFKGFEDTPSSIMLFEHKDTGVITLIDIQNKEGNSLDPARDSEIGVRGRRNSLTNITYSHSTIAQKFMSDQAVKSKFGIKGLLDTTDNMKLVRGGLLLAELKAKGHITAVGEIRIATINTAGGDKTPNTYANMSDLNDNLQMIHSLIKDNPGYEISEDYQKVMDASKALSETTAEDSLANLVHVLSDTSDEFISMKTKNHFIDRIGEHNSGNISRKQIMNELYSYFRTLGETVKTGETNRKAGIKALNENPVYEQLGKVILSYANMSILTGDMMMRRNMFDKVTGYSGHKSKMVSELEGKIIASQMTLSRKSTAYTKQINTKTKALKASNNSNNPKRPFNNLWVTDATINRSEEGDVKNLENLHKLKDPKDSSLTEAESDYIKFCIDTVVKLRTKDMTPDQKKTFMDSDWAKGLMPVMGITSHSRLKEADGVLNKIKSGLKSISDRSTKELKEVVDSATTYINSSYDSQFGSDGGRLRALGLNKEGLRLNEDVPKMEVMLDAVMRDFFVEEERRDSSVEMSAIYNAMLSASTIQSELGTSDSQDDFVESIVKMYALMASNDYKQEDIAPVVDQFKGGASLLMFGGSIVQGTMEAGTNYFNTLGAGLSETLQRGNKRFSYADLFKSGNFINASVIHGKMTGTVSMAAAIADHYHTYDADHGGLTASHSLESGGMSATDVLYFMNTQPYKHFRTLAVTAELRNKSGLEVFSQDSDGNLVYDWTKDKRYNLIVGSDGNIDRSVDSVEAQKQMAYYDYMVRELVREGSLEDGNPPNNAISQLELRSALNNARGLYGSSGADGQTEAKETSLGRVFLGFRSWVVAKKDVYIKQGNVTTARGRTTWVDIEGHPNGGEYEFTSMMDEGILQTMQTLWSAGMRKDETGRSIKQVYSDLDITQKDNMHKLVAHFIMSVLVGAALRKLYEMFEDDPYTKTIIQRLQMAAEDLNILNSLDTAGSGGLAPVVGATWSLLSGLVKSTPALAEGDLNGFMANSSIGVFKIYKEAAKDKQKEAKAVQRQLLKDSGNTSQDAELNKTQNK